jgi:hypothetical protein
MTFVTILLLIIGVIVVMAAALLGLSFLAGAHLYSRECTQASPSGADPCAQCNTDREWYEGLPLWKQNLTAAWWWANRVACASKGCR